MKLRFAGRHLLASIITIGVIVIINQGTISILLNYVFGSPYVLTVHPYVHLAASSKPCLRSTEDFVGHEDVKPTTLEFHHLEHIFNESLPGGHFIPTRCQSRARIAIIIPYRDRKTHLIHYLYNVIPKLQRQQLEFTIFVVEQATGSMFNRGMMRNIGFEEARKVGDYDCYVFNDVDTIPEDDRNIFECSKSRIRHLVSGIDRYQYRMPYSELLGGIIAFSPMQFIRVNGYSNVFFIWGAEDDDIFRRAVSVGYMIERPPRPIGYVTTLKHDRDPISDIRLRLFNAIEGSSKTEGLNSLKYKKIKMEYRKLFTWVYVDINETTVKENFWSKI